MRDVMRTASEGPARLARCGSDLRPGAEGGVSPGSRCTAHVTPTPWWPWEAASG
jgi:hypothetical protein